MTNKIEEIEKEADMKGIIRVEDYLYDGNITYGIKDSDSDGFILEDGDIFEIKELIEEGYKVTAVTGKEIFEDGQKSAEKSELEFLKGLSYDLRKNEGNEDKADMIYVGEGNKLLDFIEERIKRLEEELK